jgi:hypothetical protein
MIPKNKRDPSPYVALRANAEAAHVLADDTYARVRRLVTQAVHAPDEERIGALVQLFVIFDEASTPEARTELIDVCVEVAFSFSTIYERTFGEYLRMLDAA